MSLKIKKKASVPPIDGGTYAAICVGIIDLGEQLSDYGNNQKIEEKVLLIWELPDVTLLVDGEQKPRWISKEYTSIISDKSNLGKLLVSWRGRQFSDEDMGEDGFDLKTMIGQACLLQVIVKETKNGKLINDVTGIMGYIAGMPKPQTTSELLSFDMDAWDDEVFKKLPEWIQEKIKKSSQYQKEHAPDTPIEVKAEAAETSESECPI